MRSLILSIYVRSFDPFFWISNKIHGEQKFREVFIVLLSHEIGAQFQHIDHETRRVTKHETNRLATHNENDCTLRGLENIFTSNNHRFSLGDCSRMLYYSI